MTYRIVGKNAGRTQAIIEAAAAERCALLVEALERLLRWHTGSCTCRDCDALAAYRAAQGAGRGT